MFVHTVALCLATIVHGSNETICRTIQLSPPYATLEQCNANSAAVSTWLAEAIKVFRLSARDTINILPCQQPTIDDKE